MIEQEKPLFPLKKMEKIVKSFDNPDPELLDDLPMVRKIMKKNHSLFQNLCD